MFDKTIYFNSIKVRLKQNKDFRTLDEVGYFNSIKVRLKLTDCNKPSFAKTHFNSIKVRLKQIRSVYCHLVKNISIP